MKPLDKYEDLILENKKLQAENEFLKKALKDFKIHLKNIIHNHNKGE